MINTKLKFEMDKITLGPWPGFIVKLHKYPYFEYLYLPVLFEIILN